MFVSFFNKYIASLSSPFEAISEDKEDTAKSTAKPPMDFDKMLKKIRYQIQTKRIRVAEFFKDFDKLRSWTIKRSEFIRGISNIGIGFSEQEYEIIADHYPAKGKKDCCNWKAFSDDLERVFGEPNLESQPNVVSKPLIVQTTPFVVESVLTREEEELLEAVIQKMKEHLRVRQSSIKPFFKDFDKMQCSHRGYVTKSEFRQCLTYAQCDVTDAEFAVLAKKWAKSDDAGLICYILFLTALDNNETSQPGENQPTSEFIYNFRKDKKEQTANILQGKDADELMNRLKTKIKTQRLRFLDTMRDFDLLKHGIITANEFKRALNVSFVNLTEV